MKSGDSGGGGFSPCKAGGGPSTLNAQEVLLAWQGHAGVRGSQWHARALKNKIIHFGPYCLFS